MPLPQPKVPLTDICAVIFNNTLYTYSSEAFQALPLEKDAKWTELPSGESVTGGTCVGSTPANASEAGFWVVGGKGSSGDYKGLQKFTYSTGKWESIEPEVLVTQDRLWHGAIYLNSSDSILVYAGAQDGTQSLSSQTFTIQASEPHGVLAYQSTAPPTIEPMLLPWSDSEAALIGGSNTNNRVMLFSATAGWTDSGASLAEPLSKNITAMQAALIRGDDGSKHLYTFDMTQSPNQVNRTVLLLGPGQPVQDSPAITARWLADDSLPGGAERRQAPSQSLTVSDWPQYNGTLAPTTTRSGYAVAEDGNGLVVIAGGSGGSDVLCMFDGRSNQWENATQKLAQQNVLVESASPSSTPPASQTSSAVLITAAPTPSAAPTESPAPVAAPTPSSSSSHISTNSILGIVLGTIGGFGLILVLIYFFIRRHRARQSFLEAGHNRRASGASSTEKGGIGIASDSLPRAPAALGTFRGHQQSESQNSFSSMAILMGRVNNAPKPAPVQRHNSRESNRSSASDTFKAFKSAISKPIPQMTEQEMAEPVAPLQPGEAGITYARNVAQPRPRGNTMERQGSTRRSSGWNRYWSGGSTLNILGFGSGNANANSNGNGNAGSKRQTVETDRSSNYSSDPRPSRITQDSATVPPLDVTPMVPEPKLQFHRVNSGSPTMANYPSRIRDEMRAQIERSSSRGSSTSAYSSGIPASVHEAWDPTTMSKPWGADRAPDNAYGGNAFTTPLAAPPSGSRSASGGSRAPPPPPLTGLSRQPQLAMAATSSDMSWLNLGDGGR